MALKRKNGYNSLNNTDENLNLNKIYSQPENTLEAKVQDGDTLQAIAIRFHCTVSEIKRLNKIDKENEIYARKIIKVPVNPHSALLETMPIVHKSGQNSPKYKDTDEQGELYVDEISEKLLIASVNSFADTSNDLPDINTTRNSKDSLSMLHTDEKRVQSKWNKSTIFSEEDDDIPQPRPIILRYTGGFDFSGTDCDISWICLLILILALCFVIPLVYVLYIAEHLDKFHHN